MDMDWLWKNILSNGITYIIILIGGFVFTYLKATKDKWAPMALYGLAGAGMTAVLIASVLAINWLAAIKIPIQITPDNIQEYVANWLNTFEATVQRQQTQDSYFSFRVIMANGNNLVVERPKKLKQYIVLSCILEDKSHLFEKLPTSELDQLMQDATLEALRSLTSFDRCGTSMRLFKRIPISPELNEGIFFDTLEHLNETAIAAQIIVTRALRRNNITIPTT